MENYKESGLFWLPSKSDDKVVGELTFDAGEGVSLTLHRSSYDTWPEIPGLIVGSTGAQEVTLIDSYQTNLTLVSAPYSIKTQAFYANRLLLGHAFYRLEDLAFTTLDISHYGLAEWVDKSGVARRINHSDDGMHDVVEIRYEQPESTSAQFSGGAIRIRFSWTSSSRTEESTLKHSPYICIEYDGALNYNDILKHGKHIQDFITICTDKAVTAKQVTFRHHDIPIRMLDGGTKGEQSIEYRAALITSPAFAMRSKPRYPLDLSFDAVGGIEAIAKWMQTASGYATVVSLMTPFRSEMSSFAENSFLNVVAAAEAFHDLKYPERKEVEGEAEWASLLEAILSNVPNERKEWLSGELRYINRPSLSKRLTILARNTKNITGNLSGSNADKIKRWAGTVAGVRNELTHRRSEEDTFPGGTLHWLAESVYQVLRGCLLKEFISGDVLLDRTAASSHHGLDLEVRVESAIAQAYEILQRRRRES